MTTLCNQNRSRYPIGGRFLGLLGIGALVCASMLTLAPQSLAQMVIKGAEHVETVTPYVTERALRDLPKAKAWQPGVPIREIPKRVYPRRQKDAVPPPPAAPQRDPMLDRQEHRTDLPVNPQTATLAASNYRESGFVRWHLAEVLDLCELSLLRDA